MSDNNRGKQKKHYNNKSRGGGTIGGYGSYYTRARDAYNKSKLTGLGDYKALLQLKNGSQGAFAPDYGSRLGATVGEGIQSLLKAMGFGDYKVEYNSLLQNLAGNDPPKMVNAGNRTHVIKHREYLQDIVTGPANTFTLQSFPINPGLSQSFPWLSTIAAGFEQYRILGAIYEFNSTSADALNSTITSLGVVVMATEYDSSRPNFQNKQQMENHEFATSGRQSQSLLHAIECKPSNTAYNELWVRTGAIPVGNDPKLYDFANFQIATAGQQAASVNIGELWVTYEIEFLKPQLLTGLGLNLDSDKFGGVGTFNNTNYFGASPPAAKVGSNLGTTLTSANTIVFPAWISEGNFQVVIQWTGANTACVAPAVTPNANCQLMRVWANDANLLASTGSTTVTTVMITFIIQVLNQGALVTLSGATLPGTPANFDVVVNQINGNITT